MGEEKIFVCTLEGPDLERWLSLDRFDQVEDLVVHAIVDCVDRRMIEGDAPIPRQLLVDSNPARRVVHFASCMRLPMRPAHLAG